ncbi:MAG: hypothetical protein JWR24_3057 [Actinoallomurus sp.]|nr:hypothetical protein [Actinoallomurus sp.]
MWQACRKIRRLTESGQIDGDDFAFAGQERDHRVPCPLIKPEAVQQDHRLPGPSPLIRHPHRAQTRQPAFHEGRRSRRGKTFSAAAGIGSRIAPRRGRSSGPAAQPGARPRPSPQNTTATAVGGGDDRRNDDNQQAPPLARERSCLRAVPDPDPPQAAYLLLYLDKGRSLAGIATVIASPWLSFVILMAMAGYGCAPWGTCGQGGDRRCEGAVAPSTGATGGGQGRRALVACLYPPFFSAWSRQQTRLSRYSIAGPKIRIKGIGGRGYLVWAGAGEGRWPSWVGMWSCT